MTKRNLPVLLPLFVSLPATAQTSSDKPNPAETWKQGHSRHGEAYDVGPREKPLVMDGIGKVNFPITAKTSEVQQWFNQGVALLHSFWFFEAERSFRWALKLDPERAMCYWGLAQAAADERGPRFLKEASKRKDKVSDREIQEQLGSADAAINGAKQLLAAPLDPKFDNARRFKAYDDFEEMALHSTILIDKRGRVPWSRTGGSPFTEFDFLLKEIKRLNETTNLATTTPASSSISSNPNR